VASVIKTLRDKQLELKAREDEVAAKERDFREDRRKTDLLRLKLKQRETELKQSGLGEMNRFLAESRRTFERLVQDIREGQITSDRIKEVRAFLAATGADLEAQKAALEAEERELSREAEPEAPRPTGAPVLGFAEGRDVYVDPGNRRGTLVRKAGKGRWVVSMGSVKLTLEEAKMRVVQTQGVKKKAEVQTTSFTPDAPPAFSLDLRGFRAEEALQALEKQVDRALLAGLGEFSVVHGSGRGGAPKGRPRLPEESPGGEEVLLLAPRGGGLWEDRGSVVASFWCAWSVPRASSCRCRWTSPPRPPDRCGSTPWP